MNFSIRTLMLNMTYVAVAIATWRLNSEIYLPLVTFLILVLILRFIVCGLTG